ncbi:hypothetical protein [Actinoalloteichus hoggarensis]|nr:hypothetical protein [Actinoalloteichus hoggarensis]
METLHVTAGLLPTDRRGRSDRGGGYGIALTTRNARKADGEAFRAFPAR